MSFDDDDHWKLRVLHMRDHVQNILDFTDGMDYKQFSKDKKTIFAVLRAFQVIGEAAKKVPDGIRHQYPNVPWKEASKFRDKITHDYEDVNHSKIWEIIEDEVPVLQKELASLPVKPEDLD